MDMSQVLIVKLGKAAKCDAYAHPRHLIPAATLRGGPTNFVSSQDRTWQLRVWEAVHAQQAYGIASREGLSTGSGVGWT